jgi:hypothetical protein
MRLSSQKSCFPTILVSKVWRQGVLDIMISSSTFLGTLEIEGVVSRHEPGGLRVDVYSFGQLA